MTTGTVLNIEDGNPIALNPRYLLVPPELEVAADELFKSTNLVATGVESSAQRDAQTNIHANKYMPVVSPYLSNSNFTGYSSTAWYLVGDPQDVPAFEIAYLNGVEQPTVEEVPVAANVLGKAFRGYFDFGVAEQDPRGAVKSKGAA